MGKSKGWKRGPSPHLTHLRGRLCNQPEVGCGRRWSNTLAAAGGRTAVGGRQRVCGWAGGRSGVELAPARLVDKAAPVLGPAPMALAGAVLPLHHLGARCRALRPWPGPRQPPHLAGPRRQRSPRRQRGGCVGRRAQLAADRRQLPFAKVAVGQVRVGVRGRGSRLQHYGAAGDIYGHAGVLDEEVLQGAALEAGGPESGPFCSKTGGRGNKPALVHQGGCGRRATRRGRGRSGPGTGWSRVAVRQVNDKPAVHFILLRDEGSGAVEVLRGRGVAEEQAGEALEHVGRVKRPRGGALKQCKNRGAQAVRRAGRR